MQLNLGICNRVFWCIKVPVFGPLWCMGDSIWAMPLHISVILYMCVATSIYAYICLYVYLIYASPSSGEAYRDRRLTTNFELWVEIFCVPTCFHVRIPKPCLSVRPSVCLHPEKRYHHSFVNISPTLVIDTSMERFSRVLHHGNSKIGFFFQKKFEIRILTFDEELKSP